MADLRDRDSEPSGRPGGTVGNRAVTHTKWIVSAPIVAKLLGLVATMVLARLLVPAQFGIMAYAGTTLALFSVFQDLGITQALIADPGDIRPRLRAALAMSLGSGALFYAVLAALAWPLAGFLGEPLLGPVLAALGLVVVLQTAGQVQYALLVRQERYRALFAITILQALLYLGTAVSLAAAGVGVWSLVGGHLAAQAGRTLLLWMLSGWRPGGGGRWLDTALLRVGGALMAINVLDWAADGWVFFTLGKRLGSDTLGLYNMSFEASRMAYFGLPALAGSIVLTSYASLLDDPAELRRLMVKGLRVVHTLAFPLAAGIAALAPWLVPVVWGDKWTGAVPLLSVLALLGFAAPLPNVLVPYFVSAGRLRPLLALMAVRLVAYGIGIRLASDVGAQAIAIVHIGLMWAVSGIMLALAARDVAVGARDLGRAVAWPALRAGACGVAAGLTARALTGVPPLPVLVVATVTGGLVYVAALWFTDREGFAEAASVLARGSGVLRHGR